MEGGFLDSGLRQEGKQRRYSGCFSWSEGGSYLCIVYIEGEV